MIFRKLGMGGEGLLCGAQYGRRDRLFTRLPIHLSASSRVDSSMGPRVYSFTDLLVCGFPHLLVYGSACLLVYLVYSSTSSRVRRHHNCPRTAGRICASSSTTRARSKPSRITARMVSSPAIVPHRLSGSCASISVVMLVA